MSGSSWFPASQPAGSRREPVRRSAAGRGPGRGRVHVRRDSGESAARRGLDELDRRWVTVAVEPVAVRVRPPRRSPSGRSGDVRPTTSASAPPSAPSSHLAGTIGPRHATSPEFRRAADWVAAELRQLRPASAPPAVPRPRRRLLGRAGRSRPVRQRDRRDARLRAHEAAPRRRRPPRHRAAGAGRRGQRVRRRHRPRGRAGARSTGGPRLPVRAGRVRGRGAARPDATTTTTTAPGRTSRP